MGVYVVFRGAVMALEWRTVYCVVSAGNRITLGHSGFTGESLYFNALISTIAVSFLPVLEGISL